MAVNKTAVGFLNPVLYQNPHVLNDSELPHVVSQADGVYANRTSHSHQWK